MLDAFSKSPPLPALNDEPQFVLYDAGGVYDLTTENMRTMRRIPSH